MMAASDDASGPLATWEEETVLATTPLNISAKRPRRRGACARASRYTRLAALVRIGVLLDMQTDDWSIRMLKRSMPTTPLQLERCAAACLNLRWGSFLIHGYLNPKYTDIETGVVIYQGNHQIHVNDPSWNHTIVLKNGRIFCQCVDKLGIGAGNLRLDATTGHPGSRGYMSKILQVFRLSVRPPPTPKRRKIGRAAASPLTPRVTGYVAPV